MLLSVNDGHVHEINDAIGEVIDRSMHYGDAERVDLIMSAAGLGKATAAEHPPASVPARAFSLAIAQKCNLGCTYCYAQQGSFGGAETSMAEEVALAAIDRLLQDAPSGEKVTLAFLGGEPLVNRRVLRSATRYAAERAVAAEVEISFALTTNATLLTEDDADFLDCHSFAVTVSIDGIGSAHDQLRPFKSGSGSFERVVDRAKVLLSRASRRCKVMARVTVTPKNLRLQETLNELIALGFDGVSFSPMLSSPSGAGQMSSSELDVMLREMIVCGQAFEHRLRNGEIYPFLNVIAMLRRIHERNRDAYPCGAGGGYLGVSSKGDLFACHRFVDDDGFAMGNVTDGVDRTKQRDWIADRNVHRQEPCRACWARHLCGGGCHYEVIHSGRPACDYIRGWLHYCLSAYASLVRDKPPLLANILHAQAADP
jgi:uncharacterized protein